MEHHTQNGDAVDVGAAAQMHIRSADAPVRNRPPVQLGDIIAVTTRLVQILAEEVDCLDEMRIHDIDGLQEEKRRLSRALEAMKREVELRPEIRRGFAEDEVALFNEISGIFDEVLQENHRKLLIAKEINYRVVQAISDVVREESVRAGYDRRGAIGEQRDATPYVSLNKTI